MSSNEWFTPAVYIQSARTVLGAIDLDPASCAQANETVQATRYYSQADNGLLQPWYGRVWCNPPYAQMGPGQSAVKAWIQKLVTEYQQGNISEAICLIPNDTSTRWFCWLWDYTLCFPSRRIHFHAPGGLQKNPTFGTCFVYFGRQEERFLEVFCAFGRVVKAIDPPKNVSLNLDLWQTGGHDEEHKVSSLHASHYNARIS